MTDEKIDWQKVRARIAAFVPSAPVTPARKSRRQKPEKGTPEYEEFRAKEAARLKRYAQLHPEKMRAKSQKWAAAHPEKVKAKKRRFYQRHKEEIAEYRRQKRLEDPEKYRQQKRDQYSRAKARRLWASCLALLLYLGETVEVSSLWPTAKSADLQEHPSPR